ncbi:iron ABC transporter permease [Brachybacterium halotolerans subsp. kimchii]|uniref:FecCD family ABC transporter permease n=1 Tax=Brachybacterium halotolerans TaxID=2795215 RepID=UPI001E4695AB|nr:iron ABC transporter permease [Brachybacterium halotolerans]UEJ83574.1 iron ABC transporter permease [Brachybacterium halotolerans subsp. kimchii]
MSSPAAAPSARAPRSGPGAPRSGGRSPLPGCESTERAADGTGRHPSPGAERRAPATHGARPALLIAAVLVILLALCVASLAIGSRPVPPSTVLRVLLDTVTHLGGGGSGARAGSLGLSVQDYAAVSDLRLPRTAIALLAGAALGLAGGLIQSLTRNPMAESGILGLNAGAAFAVALAITVLGITSPAGFVWFALLGAFVGTVAVWLIGTAGGMVSPERLTLAGVALGAVLAGITSAMRLTNPQRFSALLVWESGDLSQRGWSLVVPALPFLAIGVVLALLLAPGMNLLALGDDLAVAAGAHLLRIRVLMVLAITLLAGAATVMAGPISFVGLMAPHVARWIVGPDQRRLLPLAMAISAAVMLVADVLARVILWPSEVPAGIVAAVVGAPVLIVLVRRTRASGL